MKSAKYRPKQPGKAQMSDTRQWSIRIQSSNRALSHSPEIICMRKIGDKMSKIPSNRGSARIFLRGQDVMSDFQSDKMTSRMAQNGMLSEDWWTWRATLKIRTTFYVSRQGTTPLREWSQWVWLSINSPPPRRSSYTQKLLCAIMRPTVTTIIPIR